MRRRLQTAWEKLHSSYWFLPSIMMVAAIVLSFAMVWLDRRYESAVTETLGWAYGGGADGARGLLSTIAGSMITVAGVVFSITLVALSLASAQFGPRLISNFMTDLGNQMVLGTFVSTFLYALLILRTIRTEGTDPIDADQGFVPELSVTLAIVLAIMGIIVLVYFIHHVAASVQVENAINTVGTKLERAIERLFPDDEESGDRREYEAELRGEEDIPETFASEAEQLTTGKGGYVQYIQSGRLEELGAERDIVVRVDVRIGEFLPVGAEVLHVWPGDRLDDDLREELLGAVSIGERRPHRLDVEFYITQLVEIAILALSPGMNQAFTAMSCIDQLGNVLAGLAKRRAPMEYRYDGEGRLRVMVGQITFPRVLSMSFDMIRRSSVEHVAVSMRLLEVLAILAGLVERDVDRQAVYYQASMVMNGSEAALGTTADIQQLRSRYQAVLHALGMESPQSV